MVKKFLAALLAALFAAALTACTMPAEPTAPPEPTGLAQADVDPESLPAEPAPEESPYGTFGDSGYEFSDGLKVGISAPEEFTPTEWAMADESELYYRFTVTLENGTDKPYDASMFYTTLSSGGAEMNEVFDTDSKLDGAPATPVLPGKSVSFDIGYPILSPDDVVMSVAVDWDHESLLFTPAN